jgi:acyl-CoA thioester hydrolase
MTGRIDTGEMEIRVRYAETDAMGVLHHSRHWVYFEMGRTELLRAQGLEYADLERRGVFFVVARCAARFLAPARYDEVLVLTTRTTRMGQARIDHAYELRRKDPSGQGQLLATAETTLACVNRQGQMIPIPDAVRGKGEGFTAENAESADRRGGSSERTE